MKKTLSAYVLLIILTGCQPVNMDTQGWPSDDYTNKGDQQGTAGSRKWTFIIYMAADNDLESAAIADFNELEAVRYGIAPISILVLLDRGAGYDMTNGNWTGTRLFEVKTDPNGLTGNIISPQLDCLELGLTKDKDTELNTADPMVLSRLIDFTKRAYPAEQYALFIWGHGTGWRGAAGGNRQTEPLKAVAFDDTHANYMSLPSFGRAVAGKGLSFIGFDTCYGAVLEVAYQIRNDAKVFVGSEGEILSTGWNYTALFSDFIGRSSLSISDLADAIQKQFKEQYSGVSKAVISQIQLEKVNALFTEFNGFSGTVAQAITTTPARDATLNEILYNVECYYFTNFPSDSYIDIFDFCQKVTGIRTVITANESRQGEIAAAASALEKALSEAIPSSWAKNGTAYKIGVHFMPLQGVAVPATSHELAYIKDSMAIDKNAFVEDSQHWAPNAIPKADSLLDKLFYWTF
jgi:hypothetical protein